MSDTTNSCKEEDKTRLECIQLLSTVPDAALPEIAEFLKDCIEFWNWKAQYVSPPEAEMKSVEVTMNPPTIRPEFVVDIEVSERVTRPDFPFQKLDEIGIRRRIRIKDAPIVARAIYEDMIDREEKARELQAKENDTP